MRHVHLTAEPTSPSSTIYDTSKANAVLEDRRRWDEYFPSERHFFTDPIAGEIQSVLDIGGACGGFGDALTERFQRLFAYTCIDPDPTACALGMTRQPAAAFLNGYFPTPLLEAGHFDLVVCLALFPQILDWPAFLIAMASRARRFLNVSCILRLDGTTVADIDRSYFYYLDTGRRVPQVIHNIHEIKNVLCLQEIGARRIAFYGYTTTASGNNFRCVPVSKQIKGNMMIELHPPETRAALRYVGGESDERLRGVGLEGPRATLDFTINGAPFADW